MSTGDDGLAKERRRLAEVGEYTYGKTEIQQRAMIARSLEQYWIGEEEALEVGGGCGALTEHLAARFGRVSVLEPARCFRERLVQRFGDRVEVFDQLLEEFHPARRWQNIICAFLLEHVENPVLCLKRLAGLLAPGGRLFLVVPNALSASRQMAVHMGYLDDVYSLGPEDIKVGHRRVFDRQSLDRAIAQAGLIATVSGGLMFKPLTNFRMDAMEDAYFEACYQLGLKYPELTAAIWSVCKDGDVRD